MEHLDFGRDVERFLDRVLLAANDQKSNQQAQRDLQALMTVHSGIRSRHQAPIDQESYRLGAAVALQKLFIRIIERKDGNRALSMVRRRKHVAKLLEILARARAPVMPSVLAERLRIQQPAITALLKDTDSVGLTREVVGEDARHRPRSITATGKTILNAFRPMWALETSDDTGVWVTEDGSIAIDHDAVREAEKSEDPLRVSLPLDAEISTGVKIVWDAIHDNRQVQYSDPWIRCDRFSRHLHGLTGASRNDRAMASVTMKEMFATEIPVAAVSLYPSARQPILERYQRAMAKPGVVGDPRIAKKPGSGAAFVSERDNWKLYATD
jgi:hypothetical protein